MFLKLNNSNGLKTCELVFLEKPFIFQAFLCKVSPAGRSTTSTTTRWSSPCRSLSGRSGTIQGWGDNPIQYQQCNFGKPYFHGTQVWLCWWKDEIPHYDRSKKGLIIEFPLFQPQILEICGCWEHFVVFVIVVIVVDPVVVIAGCDVVVAVVVVVVVVVEGTLPRCGCCCFFFVIVVIFLLMLLVLLLLLLLLLLLTSLCEGVDAGHILPQREERPLPQHFGQQRLHQVHLNKILEISHFWSTTSTSGAPE